nr:hypothetical protein GCM10020063_010210 [Dactylosporangium thailandense]
MPEVPTDDAVGGLSRGRDAARVAVDRPCLGGAHAQAQHTDDGGRRRTGPQFTRDVEDRPAVVYDDDLRLARQGWGPTIRAICLRISAAVATRIASRPQRSIWRSATGAGKVLAGVAAAVYAKSRGLL